MDDRRVGRLLRAVRQDRLLRQSDVAARAGISQKAVSDIELGRLTSVGLGRLRRIAAVLDVSVSIDARYHGGKGDRLLDRAHAHLVNALVRILENEGWETLPEFTFNHYGDRGSVDILAWHAATRTLLIIEVKATLTDLQDLLAALSRKMRVVPSVVRREPGWRPEHVGRILVVADTKASRSIVARHTAIFESAFPARSREARAWIRRPIGAISAVWFLTAGGRAAGPAAKERIRRPAPRLQ
jgi:transcriptional regulator with XRE-family HTH domain